MQISKLLILSLLCMNIFAFNDAPIPADVMKKAERKYGGLIVSRFLKYNKMLEQAEALSTRNKLQLVNNFFNQVPYKSDLKNWKQEDYWATPLEFLARGKGDSEDYVIAKYFALHTLGVDPKKLYFTYVDSNKFNRPHMVLSYFETPSAQPFILDNINKEILSASERSDLSPVYNFNPHVTQDKEGKDLQLGTHKKWEKLYKRVKRNKL